MQLMLIIWITINIIIIFLSQPRQRNKINDQPNKIRKGIIYTEKSILVKVQDSLIMGSFYLAIGVIIYVIFVNFSDETMQNAINWFKKVFIVTFFPIIITWITNNKEKPLRYLDIVVLGVIFSLVFHFVKIEDLKVIQQYKMFISLILSIFFVSFIILILKAIKNEHIGNKLHTNFYKDLIFKTPRINIKMDKIELIKMCEKYYSQYMKSLKKISDVNRIEFVNLNGCYRHRWYQKAARITRRFIYFSIIYLVIKLYLNINIESIINLIGIFIFVIIIYFLKKNDINFLERISIRLFYDEWGYCLYFLDGKCKFVGEIQVIDKGKYHKYVHSFLDIVAICRAIALIDEIENGNNISLISNSFYELIDNYQEDYIENTNWVGALPLWAAAMFEFKVKQELSEKVKLKLSEYYIDEKTMHEINLFISGFWVHMTQTMPGPQISEFVSRFVNFIKVSEE